MKPDKPTNSQGGMSLSQHKLEGDAHHGSNHNQSQDAAANIIRSQIDRLFEGIENTDSKSRISPGINQHQKAQPSQNIAKTNDWNQYHSAWQNYYQKYYEGYYKHNARKNGHYFTKQPEIEPTTPDEAMSDIKKQIITKVKKSATKVRKSRHFIPIISGLVVILFFLFLQYNRLLISNVMAYVSPGNIDPQNIIIDPSANLTVSPEPRLIIPKINVDVPVLYDVGNDYNSQMSAMSKGVAQFAIPGASSHPGQIGNTVIAGHSSNDLLDSGDYKFIFAQLDKLEIGDTIYANYKSKRYTYTVTKKEVVKPSEVGKLVYKTTKPLLTLLTCTPLGTATNRLLVTANQVSPDPKQSIAAPTTVKSSTKSIPGNSPTFIERLFGAR